MGSRHSVLHQAGLRTGIVLYGFKLTFQSVIDIGGSALALDLIVVTLTILLGAGLGRLLKWTGTRPC